jgi:hypothetical protein
VSTAEYCAFSDPSCPSGQRFGIASGDGLAGMCLAIPDVDGGSFDAGPGAPDASPVVPVTNGQAADLVLGQPDLTHADGDILHGPFGPTAANHPTSVEAGPGHLWVMHFTYGIGLQWNSYPVVNQQAANLTIGEGGSVVGPRTFGGNSRVSTDGHHLFVADSKLNRVLIWNAIPTADYPAADRVLGQSSFTSTDAGDGAGSLATPASVWSNGTVVIVADAGNHRVLIWRTFPTANDQPADVVLGQPAFGQIVTPPASPTAASINDPREVRFAGGKLFVVDAGYHRVMVFDGIPDANNAPADYFIGQSGAENGLKNAGGANVNAIGLDTPTGVAVAGGSLFVSDSKNHRVLVFTPVPTSSGVAASAVLGQDTLTSGALDPMSAAATNIGESEGLAFEGAHLYVADAAFNRVLRFTLRH